MGASILVVANRSETDSQLLAKGIQLARSIDARIELFNCDAEYTPVRQHAEDYVGVDRAQKTSLVAARRYLEGLRADVFAPEIEIRVDVACEPVLHEGIAKKALAMRGDLIRCVDSRLMPTTGS